MNYKGHSDTEVIANRIPSGNGNRGEISKNLSWDILVEIKCFNQRKPIADRLNKIGKQNKKYPLV